MLVSCYFSMSCWLPVVGKKFSVQKTYYTELMGTGYCEWVVK